MGLSTVYEKNDETNMNTIISDEHLDNSPNKDEGLN